MAGEESEKGQNNSGMTRRGFLKAAAGFGAALVGGLGGGFLGGRMGSTPATPLPSERSPVPVPTPRPMETPPPISTESNPLPTPRPIPSPIPTPTPQEQPIPAPTPNPLPTPAPISLPKEQLIIQTGQLGLPTVTLYYLSTNYTFYLAAIFILIFVWLRRNKATLETIV